MKNDELPFFTQKQSRKWSYTGLACWIALVGSFLSLPLLNTLSGKETDGILKEDFLHGWEQCNNRNISNLNRKTRTRNPRANLGFAAAATATLIKNCTLLQGDGSRYENVDIVLRDGLIVSVGAEVDPRTFDGKVLSLRGHVVTPGIVDMHSHMGLDGWPNTSGSSDTNEMTETPLHPELKSLDGFDPWDLAVQTINSGGVTTSLVLPGSGNMMGGEAFPFKHRLFPSNRSEDMLLNAGMEEEDGFKWRYMKMACGENPIRSYGKTRGITPDTRLGEAYLFRKRIDSAAQIVKKQDEWCRKAESAQGYEPHTLINDKFPEPIEEESLVALIRGKIRLNVHCYETKDLEMMIRLSHEFNFKINTFHHALEAWRIPDLLKKEDIAVAIFADHWGYKKEAYDTSTKAAQILNSKGVKVAFKSDHPVLNAQNLIYEAQKAYSYGLSAELAIQSITSVPAERLGQDHRIGYVKVGYDADIVIWEKNPLEIGAHPLKVIVDGYSTFEHKDYVQEILKEYSLPKFKNQNSTVEDELFIPESFKKSLTGTFVNIGGLLHSREAVQEINSKLVVENGIVTCIGSDCTQVGSVIDIHGGWITPGLIAVGVRLGLESISSESGTSAGVVNHNDNDPILMSANGIQTGRKHNRIMDAAFKAGITTSISSMNFKGSVGPLGTAFRVGAVKQSDAFIKETCGQNFAVGQKAKRDGLDSSVSGQLERIRKFVLSETPLVFKTGGSNNIFSILRTFPNVTDIVIMEGAEAHIAAKELSAHSGNVTVIMTPARCTPNDWFSQECLLSGTTPSDVEILERAGVNVGLTVPEDNFIRGLIWEAGWKIADHTQYSTFSDFEFAKRAISLVTWNIAEAFGISDKVGSIRVGQRANFVVYNELPGTITAKVKLVVDGDIIETSTEAY